LFADVTTTTMFSDDDASGAGTEEISDGMYRFCDYVQCVSE